MILTCGAAPALIVALATAVPAGRRDREPMVAAIPRLNLGDIARSDKAFHIYASVAELTDDSLDLCRRMLHETGVTAAPDVDFDPMYGHRRVRFSFALATPGNEDVIERLARWPSMQRG